MNMTSFSYTIAGTASAMQGPRQTWCARIGDEVSVDGCSSAEEAMRKVQAAWLRRQADRVEAGQPLG